MLVEFRLHGERLLGVVERPEGKKHWVVTDGGGRAHVIHPRQVTYEVPGRRFKPAEIAAFQQETAPLLDTSALATAWEFLVEEAAPVTPASLAELLFAATEAHHCYAAHALLSGDSLYFKEKGEHYEPRTAIQVEELRHQREVTEQRRREAAELLERLGRAVAGEEIAWGEGELDRLEMVERYALQGEEAPQAAAARELLAALGRDGDGESAFQLLVALRRWDPHENLALHRSRYPRRFAPETLAAAAERCTAPPADPDAGRRLDLTHLEVYAIDDHHTREVDDGISLERGDDGRERLWVHVADPTRLLRPDELLEREARERGATLYLPTGMLPMFPMELAEGPMSLREGELCPALSFAVELDEEGAVGDYRIAATLVRPQRRLTYEDVDTLLAGAAESGPAATMKRLNALAERRRGWRERQGSFGLSLPEAAIKVQGEEVTIAVVPESAARALVAEMMILAGEVAARFGMAHGVPLPFRAQPEATFPPEEELPDHGILRDFALRRCMPRTVTSLTPESHAGLGLPAYVQATSPIRRYGDLLAHFQLKAVLRGEPPPFAAEAMAELIAVTAEAAREATLVERQSKRYWALEYLRRHGERPWRALFVRWLREDKGLAMIYLEEPALEMTMTFKRPPPPGEPLLVAVSHVNPRSDEIRFRVV